MIVTLPFFPEYPLCNDTGAASTRTSIRSCRTHGLAMATGCSYAGSATLTSTVQQQSTLGICVKTSGQSTHEQHHQDKENGEACLGLYLLCACPPDLLAGDHRAGAWQCKHAAVTNERDFF